MTLDEASMLAFLFVFLRSSAMLLSAPVFGSGTIPPKIRIFIALVLAGALGFIIKPQVSTIPLNMLQLVTLCGGEVVMGLLIGTLMNLILQAATMAGAFLDLEIGLAASQVLNPFDGVSVTVIAQFKSLLAMVLFLCINGHYFLIRGLAASYQLHGVGLGISFASMESGVIKLLEMACILSLQIAAPTLAVSVVIDASLSLMNKAVPQMQALNVGIPAKLGAGLLALSLSLPPLVFAVSSGTADAYGMILTLLKAR